MEYEERNSRTIIERKLTNPCSRKVFTDELDSISLSVYIMKQSIDLRLGILLVVYVVAMHVYILNAIMIMLRWHFANEMNISI